MNKSASLSITIQNNKKTPMSDGGAQRGIEEESARAPSLLKLRLQSGKSTISGLGSKRAEKH